MNFSGTTTYLNKKLHQESPIFSKSKVNFSPTHPIVFFAASNHQIVLVKADKTIDRVNQKTNFVDHVDLFKVLSHFKINQLFLDPLGSHMILSLKPTDHDGSPELLYLKTDSSKTKFAQKVKGHLVTAIAWNHRNTSSTVTGSILMGTTRGLIFETEFDSGGDERILFNSSLEQYWKQVFDLGKGQHIPITGLEFHLVSQTRKYFILVTTPNRLYQFQGYVNNNDDKPLLLNVFNNYINSPAKFLEFPSALKTSVLSFFYGSNNPKIPLFPKSFGWMMETGIYAGKIDPYNGSNDTVTVDCSLVPFPCTASLRGNTGNLLPPPKWFVVTEFHALIAYSDVIRGVCLLNDQVVFEDSVDDVHSGKLNGIARDPVSGIYYSFTDYSIVKYKVDREERNVWKIYLEKGFFEEAKRICADDPIKLDEIFTNEAENLYASGNFVQSAVTFSKTFASFEEITLKFVDLEDKTALLKYLKMKLETLKASEKTQMTMIAVWIVEIYLNMLDLIKNKSSPPAMSEYDSINQEFVTFLKTPKIVETISANQNTVYELLADHGDIKNLITFASLMKDYEKVVHYLLQKQDFLSALRVMDSQRLYPLFYRHGPTLTTFIPREFISSLIRLESKIDPLKMIPIFAAVTENPIHEEEVMKYLEFIVEEAKCKISAVHNYLLSLYVKHSREKLTQYLEMCGSDPDDIPYDIQYALKLCSEQDFQSEVVFLLCILGELENAADLALKRADIEESKNVLRFAKDDEDVQKKIWLKIAQHVVQEKNDIKQAMDFLQQTDLVKIEDILPFFDDFVTIDHFKDAICQSLHDYSQHISSLKDEMEEANNSAETIRSEIQQFKNRYSFIQASDTCSFCSDYLMSGPFHLFTCGHKFHTDCLIEEVTPHLSAARKRKVEEIQFELSKLEQGLETDSVDSKSTKLSKKDQLLIELDDLIVSECLFCGDIMIKMIDKPFYEDEDYEAIMKEWI